MSHAHILDPALERFSESMDRRLRRGTFTTEDSVRYTFFVALNETLGIAPDELVLEQPHPKIPRAEIDTFIPRFEGRGLAVEFKYDRAIPSGANSPRPQKAGSVIHDLFRLARFEAVDAIDGLFVYLAGSEMTDYFRSPLNGLTGLFGLGQGAEIRIDDSFVQSRSQTLQGAAGPVFPCAARGLLSRSLANRHELRIYAVLPLDPAGRADRPAPPSSPQPSPPPRAERE